jgi:hypothetical protein
MPIPAEVQALFDEFLDPAEWRESQRGNLVRDWGDYTLTVFRIRRQWGWCVKFPDDATKFSDQRYDTLDEARNSLAMFVVRDM